MLGFKFEEKFGKPVRTGGGILEYAEKFDEKGNKVEVVTYSASIFFVTQFGQTWEFTYWG